MAAIVYGWGNVLKNKKIMGYSWCQSCGKFTPRYLSKLVFRVHISYIPIFMKTKGFFISCKDCKCGTEISKEEFKRLKEEFKPMTNSLAKKCFKEISQICQPINEYSEGIVSDAMSQISGKYPVTASESLAAHYRQLITDVICSKLEYQRMVSEQQQQAEMHSVAQSNMA